MKVDFTTSTTDGGSLMTYADLKAFAPEFQRMVLERLKTEEQLLVWALENDTWPLVIEGEFHPLGIKTVYLKPHGWLLFRLRMMVLKKRMGEFFKRKAGL